MSSDLQALGLGDLLPHDCYDIDTIRPKRPFVGMLMEGGSQMQFSQWLQLSEFVNEATPRKVRAHNSTSKNLVYRCDEFIASRASDGENVDDGCNYCVKMNRHRGGEWKVTEVTPHSPTCAGSTSPSAKILTVLLGCAAFNGASCVDIKRMAAHHGFELQGSRAATKQITFRAKRKAGEIANLVEEKADASVDSEGQERGEETIKQLPLGNEQPEQQTNGGNGGVPAAETAPSSSSSSSLHVSASASSASSSLSSLYPTTASSGDVLDDGKT